jgi:hypothetical protein
MKRIAEILLFASEIAMQMNRLAGTRNMSSCERVASPANYFSFLIDSTARVDPSRLSVS